MDHSSFIIDVPAGEQHQNYARIFAPVKWGEGQWLERYCICVEGSLVRQVAGADTRLPNLNSEGMIVFSSVKKPTVVLSRNGRLIDPISSVSILKSLFHDLHWVSLTPDHVIKFVSKKLLIRNYNLGVSEDVSQFRLESVQMDCDEIKMSIKALSQIRLDEMNDTDDSSE